jgi:ribosomal protein L11 methyltransferase
VKKKQWIEVTVDASDPYQDLLIGQLAAIGFEGFLQQHGLFSCYMELGRWRKQSIDPFKSLIKNFEREFRGRHFAWKTRTIDEKNWNARWERSIGIVEASSKIIVKPSWKKLRKQDKGKIVLHIDPKMAFGTGHHETTRLSLTLLEEYLHSGDKVLDFGCGTGILAISAVKLGAHSALAVDNDRWAIENAVENITRNRVERHVVALEGDIKGVPKRSFDLIIANIDLPTITKSLKHLIGRLKPRGSIILSGLLVSDLTQFMNLMSHQGIVPLEMVNENEWVAVALTKADAADGN